VYKQTAARHANAIRVLVNVISDSASSTEMLECAIAALRNLCVNSEENQEELNRCGTFPCLYVFRFFVCFVFVCFIYIFHFFVLYTYFIPTNITLVVSTLHTYFSISRLFFLRIFSSNFFFEFFFFIQSRLLLCFQTEI
jgi:hypothetical protein